MHGGLREKRRKPNRADLEGISQAHHSVCVVIHEKRKLVQHQMTMCLERVFQEMGSHGLPGQQEACTETQVARGE